MVKRLPREQEWNRFRAAIQKNEATDNNDNSNNNDNHRFLFFFK